MEKTTEIKPVPESGINGLFLYDIRICQIQKVEKIEKSDKLYKLTVNTGIDERVIVSGLAKHYSPEELLGLKLPFILNLPVRSIMGVESHGMILAAEGESKLYVLECDSEIGAIVA